MAPFVLGRDFYVAEMQTPSFAALALLDQYITDYSTHERGNKTVTKRRHRDTDQIFGDTAKDNEERQ